MWIHGPLRRRWEASRPAACSPLGVVDVDEYGLISHVETTITTRIKDSTQLQAYMPSFLVMKAYAMAENAPTGLGLDSSANRCDVDRSFSSGPVDVFVESSL